MSFAACDAPLQLLHLLLDAAADRAVAEVGVDLGQELAPCTQSAVSAQSGLASAGKGIVK